MYCLFYIRKSRIDKKNETVVYLRLKQKNKIVEMSTCFKGLASLWDADKQLFTSNDKKYHIFNSKILEVKQIVDDSYYTDFELVVLKIKEKLKEKENLSIITIDKVLTDYTAYLLERTNLKNAKKIEPSTVKAVKTLVESFRRFFEKEKIILVTQIDNDVLERYLEWKGGTQNTLSRANKQLKTILSFAEKKYKIKTEKLDQLISPPNTDITYLTTIEQHKVETHVFRQLRLDQVRDVFVFQYLTGLSYSDLEKLSFSDVEDQGKRMFIFIRRKKTNANCIIPIHDKALEIWKKYNFELPVLSNQKYNSYLKEIGEIVGIKKKLTTHLARRTAAMTLLNKGMRIDTIAAILGHENVSTTARYYAKLTAERISEEYEKIYG